MTEATAVYVVDSSDLDETGDEFATWDVYLGDDDGESIDNHRTTTSYRSFWTAVKVAEEMAAERGGLEVVTA